MTRRSDPSRRYVLFGGFCLCCLPSLARRAQAAGPVGPAPVREVAAGIHIRHGVTQDATAANDDAIANIGFVVGREAVAVFDPGGSLEDGESLRLAIRQVTKLPIRYVVLSHVHPDHVFGAGAFQSEKPVYVGHARLPAALAARGAYYQKGLDELLGKGRAGPVVIPTRLVRGRTELDLGGRILALTAHPTAHTDCDVSAIDRQTGTLLAGDLIFVNRVPSLDGDLKGWLGQIAALKALEVGHVVPGHGPVLVEWPSAAADIERYLTVLLTETRQAVAKAVPIDDAVTTVAVSERGRWKLFDDYNGHNVTEAYRELEWE